MTRLPRRFDVPMKALRELATSKNEKVRLQAVLRMSDILLAHLQSEDRAAIAIERAAARRAEAEAGTDQPASLPEGETAEQIADRLISAYRQRGSNGNDK
jgi:hypothetical protein